MYDVHICICLCWCMYVWIIFFTIAYKIVTGTEYFYMETCAERIWIICTTINYNRIYFKSIIIITALAAQCTWK